MPICYWVTVNEDGDENLLKSYASKKAAENEVKRLEQYKELIIKNNPKEKWRGLDKTTYRVIEEEI